MTTQRNRARTLALQALHAGTPSAWFETLYREAEGNPDAISWADRIPNPNLSAWLEHIPRPEKTQRALVVGCGLGDDAELLARRGWKVCAFDVSQTAISWCKTRWPNSPVEYVQADLLNLPPQWDNTFDLVVEIYTLQVLPLDARHQGYSALFQTLREEGRLLVICRGRNPEDHAGEMPWPLTRDELQEQIPRGFRTVEFEDFMDQEDPPVRRFRLLVQRIKKPRS